MQRNHKKEEKPIDKCEIVAYNSNRNTNTAQQERSGYMMNLAKEYTPDQISDAEKLCQLMRDIPDGRRQLYAVSMMAYMSGCEAGAALERNARQKSPA